MDERPTIQIVLPRCKATVYLYSFMRNGDFRLMQRRLGENVKLDPKNPQGVEFTLASAIDEQEIALELMSQKVLNAAGEEVADKKDFFYNLDISDADVLYAKVNELTVASNLTEESKKK